MRLPIHHHYSQLTEKERDYVDTLFGQLMFELANARHVPLCGDDRLERAADAFSRTIIESRDEAKP